jgi:tetratricopeptide (TPR) repeat protein
MTRFVPRMCRHVVALILALLLPLDAAWPQQASDEQAGTPLILDLEWLAPSETLSRRPPPPPLPEGAASAMTVLSRGRWVEACGTANRILAQRVPDIEALGIFGLCAVLSNDARAASLALARLQEIETVPHFALLAEGLRQLKSGRRDVASARFTEVLRRRADDPLALYFRGEASHAAGDDLAAVDDFEAVLRTWPEHVPALTAAARVLGAAEGRPDSLLAARDYAERATRLDPWTRANWRLLAELCARTGQPERAAAITLQWLGAPLSTN